MNIKVCGITNFEQLQQLQQLSFDFAGFIFYEKSKRFAGHKLENKKKEIRNTTIRKIGVFVNEEISSILKSVDDFGLFAVQLHGDETVEFCEQLRKKIKVIKAFRIEQKQEFSAAITKFKNACDYFLFDTAQSNIGSYTFEEQKNIRSLRYEQWDTPTLVETEGASKIYGGTGEKFDWNILQQAHINKPFFLSGGIKPADVNKIRSLQHPHLFAVDINSGFEIEPGEKNITSIRNFKLELENGKSEFI